MLPGIWSHELQAVAQVLYIYISHRRIHFQVIDAIANAVRNVAGVELLDVDAGQSTNRTVYTFVGGPDAIIEGALAAAKAAFPLIDMTKHKGEEFSSFYWYCPLTNWDPF